MPKVAKKLTSSLEDYLEAILDLTDKSGRARVRDIAERIGVGKPAVTAALKELTSRKLIAYAPYKPITLTKRGWTAGEVVRRRHKMLKDFMIEVLGLDESSADSNACRVEHAIDRDFRERLGMFAEYIHHAPPRYRKWIADFVETANDKGEI
ncbi:MAG: metal-dependent transcriptional regulator [Phycisphaerae bacterium]|nr:metal-dependent transcriptional regulator [Phycisphaerae bacterium]